VQRDVPGEPDATRDGLDVNASTRPPRPVEETEVPPGRGPVLTSAQLGVLAAAVHQVAGALQHPAVIALDMPVNPADKLQPTTQGSQAGQPAATLGAPLNPAARDLRTLTAAGATSTNRRTLTAATAGALALPGTLLGSAGAYLALAAGHRSDLGTLSHLPVPYLAITIPGVPGAAALTGWILAGRQPPSISRQALE
jgi:hypothetical protein